MSLIYIPKQAQRRSEQLLLAINRPASTVLRAPSCEYRPTSTVLQEPSCEHQTYSSTCLQTGLFISLYLIQLSESGPITYRFDSIVTRELPIQNCLQVNAGRDRRLSPIYFIDCPCDLLIVITKAGRIGNCLRVNGVGIYLLLSLDYKGILYKTTSLPSKLLPIIFPLSIYLPYSVSRIQVLLQRRGISRFLINITGVPTFNYSLYGSSNGLQNLFQYSLGNISLSLGFTA